MAVPTGQTHRTPHDPWTAGTCRGGRIQRLGLRLALVAAAACGRERRTDPDDHTPPAAPARPVTAAAVDAEARALLGRWLAAQNAGRLDEYLQLYDRQRFVGIKRTSAGRTTRYDAAGWRADRARMFSQPQTVAAEEISVRTWLAPDGARLPVGVVEISFLQRWKSERYADQGIKVIRLLRERGGPRIVYEDMKTSAPGWDAQAPFAIAQRLDRELRGLSPEDRRRRLAALRRETVEALTEVDCWLAGEAVLAREAAGDASLIPRRRSRDLGPDAIARAACIIGSIDDMARRRELLADYLAPTGAIRLAHEECPEPGEGGGRARTVERSLTLATATGDEIGASFGGAGLSVCRPGSRQDTFTCAAVGNGDEVELQLARWPDRRLYIVSIVSHHLTGCDC